MRAFDTERNSLALGVLRFACPSAHETRDSPLGVCEDDETLAVVAIEDDGPVDVVVLSILVQSEVKSFRAAAPALAASLAACASASVPPECRRPAADGGARSENVDSEDAREKGASSGAAWAGSRPRSNSRRPQKQKSAIRGARHQPWSLKVSS